MSRKPYISSFEKNSAEPSDKESVTHNGAPHKGGLYLLATPIGNLDDMTIRGVRTLEEADVVYAEDTRRTRILLEHFNIRKKLEAYHIFNEHGRTASVIRQVEAGEKIVLVSDAGTPCIADPGFLLMREAVEAGIEPVIIPGVSALTFAVSASALPSEKLTFFGFLPVKSGRRSAVLSEIAGSETTCVAFESPYRIQKLLEELSGLLPKTAKMALVREATKIHEEVLRGTPEELCEKGRQRNGQWKGEFVVVIDPQGRVDGRKKSDDGSEGAEE